MAPHKYGEELYGLCAFGPCHYYDHGHRICEESGLLVSLLNRSMRRVPPALVPYLIAFVGTLGNIASDTAAVVIPPLGALVYLGVKSILWPG